MNDKKKQTGQNSGTGDNYMLSWHMTLTNCQSSLQETDNSQLTLQKNYKLSVNGKTYITRY